MRRLNRILFALAGLAWGSTSALPAQERIIPLDTLRVEASSRAGSELVASTRGVEVITAEAIRRLPAASISDVLQWAFGVDLMPRSPALADVALRGSSFEQVLVLVDGVRVSDAQTGHFDLNLAVPLDQVERIEVLRGPASTLHGADAVGGVINVVTRREGSGLAARAEAGSFDTRGVALSHGFEAGALRADVAGELRGSDGHRPGTDYEVRTGRIALQAPLAGHTLTADLSAAARDFGAADFYAPYPSYEETRTTTASLALRAEPGRRFALEPLLSVRRHGDDFILIREKPEVYRNRHETLQVGGELTGRLAVSPTLRVAGGVEAYSDRLESATLGDSLGRRSENRAAALAEVVAGRVGSLTGAAGVRADWHELHGVFLSPSASAAWWPASGLRVRASAGRAFRSPTWTERFYRDPRNQGDPALAPERAWSAELGFDAYLPGAGVRLGAAGFVRHASDLIDWARPLGDEQGIYRTRNVEEARFRGLEAELAADDLLGLRWTARGTWLSLVASVAPGFESKYALRPMVETLALAAERAFASGVGLSLQAQRARRSEEEAYLRVDARGSYTYRRARLYLDVQNLFDEEYQDIVRAPAPGRALLLGVEWR